MYTSKAWMYACCTKVTRRYKEKHYVLSGFDEETWDLSLQVKDKD
jgi:hypothetical protein